MVFYIKLSLTIFLLSCAAVVNAINNTDFLDAPEHQFWFDINDLPTIELVVDEEQWQLLLTSTKSERVEVSGKFIYFKNNQTYMFENIGIKLSGNTSFVLPESTDDQYVQANFTLDFDEFIDDQTLSGISALKLKRFHNEPTYAHEPLSNQIMQNFNVWTVHSSTYVKLTITVANKGSAYYGIYRLNESVNRHEYLDKRFGSDNDGGFLWQGNYKDWGPAHFSRIDEEWGGVGDFDEASFEYKGKGKKYQQAHAQLVDFALNVTRLEGDAFENYIDQYINMPLLLKGLASESILGHWDGFWGNGNNYFIYFDEAQVMHFIPYDTDNTLGTSSIVVDSGTQDPINFASSDQTPLLVKKILTIDKHLQTYKSYIEKLVTQADLMVESYAVNWIQNRHAMINNQVANDTGDNQVIDDQPADWGNQGDYRIFDFNQGRNWYQTRLNSVNKVLKNDFSLYDTVYYRGVTNQWQASLMTEVSSNVWTISVVNNPLLNADGEPRFKFDILADWSENYGDDDADGFLEQGGDNILFTQDAGEYLITFNAIEKTYLVVKVNDSNIVPPEDDIEPLPLFAPIANAGANIEIFSGDTVHFDGRQSNDVDGEIVSYHWSNNLEGASVFFVYSQTGTYEVMLTVTDNDNQTATDTVIITVLNQSVESLPTEIKEDPSNRATSGGGSYWLSLFLLMFLCLKPLVVSKTDITKNNGKWQ